MRSAWRRFSAENRPANSQHNSQEPLGVNVHACFVLLRDLVDVRRLAGECRHQLARVIDEIALVDVEATASLSATSLTPLINALPSAR